MRKIISATVLLLASSYSLAATDPNRPSVMSNFSYDYYEARLGVSPITYGAKLSMSIHPNAHVIARLDSKLKGDYDLATGMGFHAPANNWADFTGQMLVRMIEPEHSNNSDLGMELTLGVRQWLGPQLEVGGKAGYLSMDDTNDWIGSVYARFHSTELFAVAAEARFNDNYDNQVMMTARFKY